MFDLVGNFTSGSATKYNELDDNMAYFSDLEALKHDYNIALEQAIQDLFSELSQEEKDKLLKQIERELSAKLEKEIKKDQPSQLTMFSRNE